ncbi:unnamed protein product [Rhodiola kirilowii]
MKGNLPFLIFSFFSPFLCANDDHERSILTKLKQQCGVSSHPKWREWSLI